MRSSCSRILMSTTSSKSKACVNAEAMSLVSPIWIRLFHSHAAKSTLHVCRQSHARSFYFVLLPRSAFLQTRQTNAELVPRTTLLHKLEEGGTHSRACSLSMCPQYYVKNTGACVSPRSIPFQQLTDVIGIFTLDASEKQLLSKKHNEAGY